MDSIIRRFSMLPRPHMTKDECLDLTRPITRREQLQRFGNAVYTLYWQAEHARPIAMSWRHFCVGCAAWAFRADASTMADRWRVFRGMNTKVAEGARNICAEPIAINAATTRLCTEVIGIVVVGNPREEDTARVLHPCEHCRFLMKHHPLITPETIIISALPPKGDEENMDQVLHEVHTFEELLKQYGEP